MDRDKVKKRLIFYYAILWLFLFIALYLAYFVYFVDTTSTKSKWVGLFAGAISLLLSAVKLCEISFVNYKNPLQDSIIKYFTTGVNTFLAQTNKFSLFFGIILGLILNNFNGSAFTVTYAVGLIIGIFSLFIISKIATTTNVKLNFILERPIESIYKLITNGSIAISMCLIGLNISTVVILFHIFKDYQAINGYLFGIMLISLFNTLCSTISKKGTTNALFIIKDIENIDENDKRNPLLLLNGLTKSIFKSNVLSMELGVTFLAALFASMTLGGYCYNLMGSFLPIIIIANGIFASILIIVFNKRKKLKNPITRLYSSILVSGFVFNLLNFYVVKTWFKDDINLVFSIILGSIMGFILCFISANCIFEKYKPVKNVLISSINGKYNLFIQSLKEGMINVFAPVLIIALDIIFSFLFAYGIQAPAMGIFGISLSIIGFIGTLGINIAISIFGLISNNSDSILENYEQTTNIETSENILGNFGHYAILLGKNFINATSIIVSIIVVVAYTVLVEQDEIDILNPYVLSSLVIGSSVPFVFVAQFISSGSKAAKRLIFNVKKQFRHNPQILNYEMRPNYEENVKLIGKTTSIQAIVSISLFIILFYLIGKYLNKEALAGFVIGIILASIGIIFTLSNCTSIIKTAKKYFYTEYKNTHYTQEYGQISDSEIILNIISDLINPCLISLIKFASILALIIAPFYIKF